MTHKEWREGVADNPHFAWCLHVAGFAAAMLVTGKRVSVEQEEETREIIAEEIFVRMVIGEVPPPGRP
jgi:hypothetical protein